MRLYFIRHGQSVNNLLWVEKQSEEGRSHDPELTPRGVAQAEHAAAFLRDELGLRMPFGALENDAARPTVLYTSLMTRAVQTGHIIASALDIPLVALEHVFEVGGLYLADPETGERRAVEGRNREQFLSLSPNIELPVVLGERGWYNRAAELNEEGPARAQGAWQEILQRHGASDDVIGLVTHGAFYNYLLAHILQIPAQDRVWFTLNNCAITRLDMTERGTALVYMNRFDFMPPDLIT